MNGAWAKAFGEHRAPHVVEMINREREMRKWVITSVVKEHGVRERASMVAKFVEIAEVFFLSIFSSFIFPFILCFHFFPINF